MNKLDYQLLENFWEKNNDIWNIFWYIRIWDFDLEKNKTNHKIIENAKVGISIYWIKTIKELEDSIKNIIVVIPALTWNAKVFSVISSQWDGWANTYGNPWNILDPNDNIIIGLDYFGGPYDSSAPDKHSLDFYPVPPEKQVEAWKKALQNIWVKKIYALFGGSNWWWHIHSWLFDNSLTPKKLIPVAWPIAPKGDAKEFFSYQIDFLKYKEYICERLDKNLSKFLWISKIYDFLVKSLKEEIVECIENWDNKKAIKIAREIWFLRFLNPPFFDKFYFDKNWKELNLEEAKDNVSKYFINEWIKFEQRFSISSLILLSESIAHANRISPKKYVDQIPKSVDLIIVSIEDDNLFSSNSMTEYFNQVADYASLPRPPQISMKEAEATLSEGMVSYLKESRRIKNDKMLQTLQISLKYPTLDSALRNHI